jgi:hypothetical protein
MVPITGAAGVGGCVLITALPDAEEVHPTAFVTVKINVPAGIPDTVVLVPVPVLAVPSGVLVNVHVPVSGNPFRRALPVATAHVGWVIVPTVGAVGVNGCVLITTSAETGDMHPETFVTVKVYVPAGITDTVVLVPVPEVVIPPGVLVKVQVSVAGKPFNTALPVATVQVGWVIVPTSGAVGVKGWVLITTLTEATEVHPDSIFTVKVYELAARSEIVVLVPLPVVVIASGFLVSVQVPDDGNPFRATLPVAVVQFGW